MNKDQVFIRPGSGNQAFEFNAEVASVFDDMIARSVPSYDETQELTTRLIQRFTPRDSVIYDLGCSTGTTLVNLAQTVDRSIRLVGIDQSAPMIDEARRKLSLLGLEGRIVLQCLDLLSANLDNAGGVVLNYTLQFLPVERRLDMLKSIKRSLLPGGLLIMTEKLRHESESLDQFFKDIHYEFKRVRGYSELEISQKREALENVLVPLSLKENFDLLYTAGFVHSELCVKSLSFATFCAQSL